MITNFEEITKPLTEEEKTILIKIYNLLEHRSKELPIKAPDLVLLVRKETYLKRKFTEPRLRKIINFIRGNGILPVIGTSRGYYCSYNTEEILKEMQSLEERSDAIQFAKNGLRIFLTKNEQLNLLLG